MHELSCQHALGGDSQRVCGRLHMQQGPHRGGLSSLCCWDVQGDQGVRRLRGLSIGHILGSAWCDRGDDMSAMPQGLGFGVGELGQDGLHMQSGLPGSRRRTMHYLRVRQVPARSRVRRLSGGSYLASREHVARALSGRMRGRLIRAAWGTVRAVRGGQVQGNAGIGSLSRVSDSHQLA